MWITIQRGPREHAFKPEIRPLAKSQPFLRGRNTRGIAGGEHPGLDEKLDAAMVQM